MPGGGAGMEVDLTAAVLAMDRVLLLGQFAIFGLISSLSSPRAAERSGPRREMVGARYWQYVLDPPES